MKRHKANAVLIGLKFVQKQLIMTFVRKILLRLETRAFLFSCTVSYSVLLSTGLLLDGYFWLVDYDTVVFKGDRSTYTSVSLL